MAITKYRAVVLSLTALCVGLFAGCGSSGGSEDGSAATSTVTGVAATGAPVAGIVYLKDSSATPTELSTTAASDGTFAFNTAGLTPPFIVKTTSGATKLYSLATENGIANITPLTTMALAQAAAGANLDTLYGNHSQSDINAAAGKMPAAVKAVHDVLAPLMDSFGVTSDIVTGTFSANHTGMDALLDAISVSISAGTVSVTNKQSGAVVLTAPCANIAAGSLVAANMPMSPMMTSQPDSTTPSTPTTPAPAPTPAPTPTPTPTPTPAPVKTWALYNQYCSGCHGTSKQGKSASAIQTAINNNTGGMGTTTLKALTSAQITSLAAGQ